MVKWLAEGRFQRATGIDTTKVRTYLPAYKRTGFAAKIGYGTETSFIDFVYMRSKDDDSSLPTQYMDSAFIFLLKTLTAASPYTFMKEAIFN